MSQIGGLVVLNLVIGFGFDALGAGIDNAAHVGGLLAGLWLGFVLPPIRSTLALYWQQPAAPGGSGGATATSRGVARGRSAPRRPRAAARCGGAGGCRGWRRDVRRRDPLTAAGRRPRLCAAARPRDLGSSICDGLCSRCPKPASIAPREVRSCRHGPRSRLRRPLPRGPEPRPSLRWLRFFTGVTSTGIYCRPSCPATTPKVEHVRFYPTAAAAQDAGFRACKRCIPGAVPGSPAWDLEADVAGRAMRLIADGIVEREGVPGPRPPPRLQRPPGAPPSPCRPRGRAAGARARPAGPRRPAPPRDDRPAGDRGRVRGRFRLPAPVQRDDPPGVRRGAHRTARGAPPRGGCPERADHAAAGPPGAVRLAAAPPLPRPSRRAGRRGGRATGPTAAASACPTARRSWSWPTMATAVRCALALADPRDLAPAVARCRRLLDLDADPVAVDETLGGQPFLADLVRATPGRRSPGAADASELAVRAVLGQGITVAAARTLAGRLVEAHGVPLADAPRRGDAPLPGGRRPRRARPGEPARARRPARGAPRRRGGARDGRAGPRRRRRPRGRRPPAARLQGDRAVDGRLRRDAGACRPGRPSFPATSRSATRSPVAAGPATRAGWPAGRALAALALVRRPPPLGVARGGAGQPRATAAASPQQRRSAMTTTLLRPPPQPAGPAPPRRRARPGRRHGPDRLLLPRAPARAVRRPGVDRGSRRVRGHRGRAGHDAGRRSGAGRDPPRVPRWHAIPAARLAGAPGHPSRGDTDLRRAGRPPRDARRRPGRRRGRGQEPDLDRRARATGWWAPTDRSPGMPAAWSASARSWRSRGRASAERAPAQRAPAGRGSGWRGPDGGARQGRLAPVRSSQGALPGRPSALQLAEGDLRSGLTLRAAGGLQRDHRRRCAGQVGAERRQARS